MAPVALASSRAEDLTERAMFNAIKRRTDDDTSFDIIPEEEQLHDREHCECLRILLVDDNVFNLFTF